MSARGARRITHAWRHVTALWRARGDVGEAVVVVVATGRRCLPSWGRRRSRRRRQRRAASALFSRSGHGWTGDVYGLHGDDAAAPFQNRRRGLNPAAASSSPLGLTWCRDRRKGTKPRVLRMRKAMPCHVMPLPIVSVPYRAKFLTCVVCRFADLETHTHTHTHTRLCM